MIRSTYYAYWAIKIGLAVVFLWFGASKLIVPETWTGQLISQNFGDFLIGYNITATQIIYIWGIIEILSGLSFVTGVFIKIFAPLSILLLLGAMLLSGPGKEMVYSFGLIGGLSSLILWPESNTSI
jgi:uncharacterized membrane protein YphA (DoxX/SURF4 family)